MNNLLDEAFAFVVARMRFAGKNKLNRALLVLAKFHDVVELLKNQRRAFVSGEAPREANRERVGIQQMIETDEIALAQFLILKQQTASRKFDQLAARLARLGFSGARLAID